MSRLAAFLADATEGILTGAVLAGTALFLALAALGYR